MKKSKYLLLGVLLSMVMFTACGSDSSGITSGQIDDTLSSNYLLKNISLDAPSLYDENDPNATKIPLNYSFNPSAWTYRVDVPNAIDVITITAEKEHHWAAIYLGSVAPGNELTDRDPSGPVSLAVGENLIKVIVVAEDGQLNEYTVTVTRHTVEHADATLSAFTVGGVTGLSPEFTVGTTTRTFSANTGNSEHLGGGRRGIGRLRRDGRVPVQQ